MDNNQLNELATNARLGHWPLHLGVRTEAEKVECLANAIQFVTAKDIEVEALEDQIEALGEEAVDLQNKIDSRDDQIEKLETKIEELNEQIAELKAESAK
jgi:peptidoglycan hydrolase CwlO-like protein